MSSTAEERPRIVGLETEHVVLYEPLAEGERGSFGSSPAPGDPSDLDETVESPRKPPFELLQTVLFEALLNGRKAAASSGFKGGFFLENGGLVHMESYIRRPADAPILEASTPECRSPWDLLLYSRAFDTILEETSRRSELLLARHGYAGRLVFGKNNRDPRGVGYGCHENYLVYSRATPRERVLRLAAAPLILLCYSPLFIHLLIILLLGAIWLLLLSAVHGLPRLVHRAQAWLRRRAPWIPEAGRVANAIAQIVLLWPFHQVYTAIVRRLAFGSLLRHLTPFLVTRPILCGSGLLNFEQGAYELSQRPGLTQSLARARNMFGRHKTIFDLKGFLVEPLALFRTVQKLSLTGGDSNLSDVPNVLKLGATLLVIEMIEAGESFEDLRVSRPVRALKAVSLMGPWKEVSLRSRGTMTATEIQREYLARAAAFFRDRAPGRLRHDEVLKLWSEALEESTGGPRPAVASLDWIAKKSILDRAVLPRTNWKIFFAWGRILEAAGLERSARAEGLEDLLRRVPAPRRISLRRLAARLDLDPSDFHNQRDLHFQARKIDLRYHELGGSGYQRALEAEGWIRRLADEAAVERAVETPPQDTRARVRGYFIGKSGA
ncbi:MAG TPA: proteasome accessory factor PafA2 family protein, partial [Planctomycetota bacterium]|nr:proteasome accessory factor PafA2 family protein [Planctomycetota bacterium]